jgi:hypothetical protein
MPYATLTSSRIGGIFVLADGSRRIIPNQFLNQAKLENETLLRLHYSFGTVEITGERLDNIFHDIGIGKLGTVEVDTEYTGTSATAPAITSIIYVPESASAASERESHDA